MPLRRLFTVIIVIFIKHTIARLLASPKPPSALAECLLQIIQDYVKPIRKVTLQHSTKYATIASAILEKLETPVTINAAEQVKSTGLDVRVPSELILVLDEDPNVFDVVNGTLWNGESRFLLLAASEIFLEDIFKGFWQHKLINVFVLLPIEEEFKVYTFLPFSKRSCSEVDILLVDEWRLGRFEFGGMTEMRNRTRLRELNGCPLNVSFVDIKPNAIFPDYNYTTSSYIDGTEGKLLTEIAEIFNFNATYVNEGVRWGWIFPGPPVGVVGAVYTGRSDFGFGLLAPTIERHEHLELSKTYSGMECITFGLPKGAGKKQPTFINILIFEFSPLMWLLIVVSFVLTFFTLLVLNKNSHHHEPFLKKKGELLLYVYSLLLGTPVKQPHTPIHRMLFFFWVWTTFILAVAYQSSMGSKLTVPTPDPDVDTFKQLLASELKVTGYLNLRRLLIYKGNDGDIRNVEARYVNTEYDVDVAVEKIVTHRDMAHARHATTFQYYGLINPRARGKVHTLTECFYKYFPRVVTPKRGPYLNRLNQIITRLFQSGIVMYWRSQYITPVPPIPQGFVKLSINHMLGLFLIIGAGYVASAILFIGEIIFYFGKRSRIQFKIMRFKRIRFKNKHKKR